jgi:hypothetical protein
VRTIKVENFVLFFGAEQNFIEVVMIKDSYFAHPNGLTQQFLAMTQGSFRLFPLSDISHNHKEFYNKSRNFRDGIDRYLQKNRICVIVEFSKTHAVGFLSFLIQAGNLWK